MGSFGIIVAVLLLAFFSEEVQGLEVKKVEPYIVMMKKKKPVSALQHRVQARSNDISAPYFQVNIDHRAVFGASPDMPGFRMISSKEAADEVSKDPDVLFVERDSAISIEDY